MNFDYTYITLFGFTIFEPVTILTNLFILAVSLYIFFKLRKFKYIFAKSWASFILLVGISSAFGSFAHGIHYQLGPAIFNITFYLMNAASLISVYFCFMSAYSYTLLNRGKFNIYLVYFVVIWIIALLVYALLKNNFILVKINAGLVLIYSLIAHISLYRKQDKGSGFISLGIAISFTSILVHSLKLSISEYFNYKDIAHLIIVTSLLIMYKGVRTNIEKLEKAKSR